MISFPFQVIFDCQRPSPALGTLIMDNVKKFQQSLVPEIHKKPLWVRNGVYIVSIIYLMLILRKS